MTEKERRAVYKNALVYTTKACNLRCTRCFMADCKDRFNYSMTQEQFRRIITRLEEQSLRLDWMCLSGGEATLWPHLKWAIDYAKDSHIVKHVSVGTNAIGRVAQDYGNADVVCITHYGAINRYDIMRLKKGLKRKQFRLQYVVHLPWPFPGGPNEQAFPADCGCINLAFVDDRVYPCGMSAAREAGDSVSVEEPFYKLFMDRDPSYQELCKICLSNRKNKTKYLTGLTFEFGVWDSAICWMHTFNTKALIARRLYRWFNKLRNKAF